MTYDSALVGKAPVAFQGQLGANSHLAMLELFPQADPFPCATFYDALNAIFRGLAEVGVIAIENTLAGRVADIHHLLPSAGLFIVGEHFQPIHHQLLGVKGATIEDLKTVHSHQMALAQCQRIARDLGLKAVVHEDTAGAARDVAQWGDPTVAAIAPRIAAEIYGLDLLAGNVEDAPHNTTRFVVLAREPIVVPIKVPTVISFVFRVRNVSAALYKVMGGFATNGINMIKLESYQLNGSFTATQFYAEIEGHPDERRVRLAFEELEFFSSNVKLLGSFKAHPYRHQI